MTYTLIEYMPVCFRGSHERAGNSGRYPHNGATRAYVVGLVDPGILDRQWARVVEDGVRLPEGETAEADIPGDALRPYDPDRCSFHANGGSGHCNYCER